MARDDAPPFGRGEYSTQAGAFDHLIGKEWVFEDIDYSVSATNVGAKTFRTGFQVTCRLVRNDSLAALLPKRVASFSQTAGEYAAVVDGYVTTTAQRGFPVDEFLPAAGAPSLSYFYIVVKGPAMVLTPLAGTEFNGDAGIGAVMVALTAATSGATTSGRLAVQNITGSSQATDYSFLVNQVENYVGRALSARTTGNTNADLLIDVGHW